MRRGVNEGLTYSMSLIPKTCTEDMVLHSPDHRYQQNILTFVVGPKIVHTILLHWIVRWCIALVV